MDESFAEFDLNKMNTKINMDIIIPVIYKKIMQLKYLVMHYIKLINIMW